MHLGCVIEHFPLQNLARLFSHSTCVPLPPPLSPFLPSYRSLDAWTPFDFSSEHRESSWDRRREMVERERGRQCSQRRKGKNIHLNSGFIRNALNWSLFKRPHFLSLSTFANLGPEAVHFSQIGGRLSLCNRERERGEGNGVAKKRRRGKIHWRKEREREKSIESKIETIIEVCKKRGIFLPLCIGGAGDLYTFYSSLGRR